MPKSKKRPATVPISVPMTMPLQDIYTNLCPVCREVVVNLITRMAEKGQLHNAIKGQLEAKNE